MAAQHLVAKCVNDILGYGAQVLFFMPYITCGKADEDVAKSLVDGLATACSKAGSTLLEREIVHVADLYPEGSRTLSGCSIGIVEREHKLPRLNKMKEGDVVIGLPDTGLHCNSSSLIGNILHKCSADYGSSLPVYNEEKSWGDLLVSPSPIYSQMLLSCIQSGHVRAFAAVTEKGLLGTIHHLLPDYLGVIVDALFWTIPAVFSWLYQEGALSELEMVNNFNCGIGAVLIAQKSAAQELVSQLHKQEEAWVIGALIQHQTGQTRVRVTHLLEALRVNSFPITRKIGVNPAPGNARKVAVFISDPGTRLKLLTDFTRQPRSCARLSLVLSNKSTVEELRRSAGAGIPTRVIDHTLCQCHSEFEATICNVLKEFSIDLICLAGFVRNLSNPFLDKWKGKILTLCPLISPSLEPKQCQESGVRVNGCTVRYMLVGTTPGPVILQETFKAEEDIDQSVAEQMEEAKSRAITKSICLVASGLVQLGEDGGISWNYLE
ncbi:hypothetical protein GDO86_019890 [Hymenochirus boettgeri]|uniref:phosphoribosylformylglycinamidine cyclo-ligase n=1 Tax=Hymenochirus boettgeri TaxID=247094 RepID=A0A8T2IC48_9PIPI|nr:hypothetical protein GDO86_019890 [Hymenochirus boettgeri]